MSSSQRSGTKNCKYAKSAKPGRGQAIGSVPTPLLERLLAAFLESATALRHERFVSERVMKSSKRSFREEEWSQAQLTQHNSRIETAEDAVVSSPVHVCGNDGGCKVQAKERKFLSGLSEAWLAEVTTGVSQKQEHEDMAVNSTDISTFGGSDVSHPSFCTSTDHGTSFLDETSSCFTFAVAESATSVVHSGNGICSYNVHVNPSLTHPERTVASKTPSAPKRRELHETTWEKALPTVSGVMPKGVLHEDENNVLNVLSCQLV